MNYEDDIYREPVWNQEEAANFFNNQTIMAAQVPDQTPVNDDGWADIMKSGAGMVGGGKVSNGGGKVSNNDVARPALNVTPNQPPQGTGFKKMATSLLEKWLTTAGA